MPLWPNEKYTIKELFDAISIYSANAATLAIAEYIGGSEANWIERMKAKLNEWGIKDATIINVTGLPNKYGGSEKIQLLETKTKIVCLLVLLRLLLKI